MQAIMSRLERVSPVWLAFFASLLLSLIAVSGEVTVGKDAAFYLDIARQTAEQGLSAAQARFNWPWFVYLLAMTHKLLGLPLELAAYLWCALFMAGTCALLVASVRRVQPVLAPWACLVVLSVPAFNDFRNDILREFGFWFFSVLALWLALGWQQRGGWLRANAIHLAILMAVLFRLEAVLLFGVVFIWRLWYLDSREGWMRLLQLALLPAFGVLGAAVILFGSELVPSSRIVYYISLLDPSGLVAAYREKTQALADAVFAKYLVEQAGMILLIMLVGTIALFYIMLCGPLMLVFLHRSAWQVLGAYWRDYRPFALAALAYVLVLLVFFLQADFINSRYASYLHLLSVPLLSMALWSFYQRFPRLGKVLIALLLVQILANVISTGAKKTHYVEVGQWLAEHVEPGPDIYYEDGRFAYYAGFGYPVFPLGFGVAEAMSDEHVEDFRYLVIEVKPDEPWLQEWLARHERQVLVSFANRRGKTVLVIGR